MRTSLNQSRSALLIAIALVLNGCDGNEPPTGDRSHPPLAPVFGLNGGGGTVALEANGLLVNGASCMGDDALASGLINGLKAPTDLNCTSTDISLTQFMVTEYSFDAVTFTAVSPTDPIGCELGQTIYLRMYGILEQRANSPRSDVGVWVSFDGPSALAGSCQQYTLAAGDPGIFNLDGDMCGDLYPGARSPIPFGLVEVQCRDDGSGFVQIASCIGWKQPGSDDVCPLFSTRAGYRWGSLPAGKSKCNCQTTLLPVIVSATPLEGKS